MVRYRPDVDGLRAIAILTVVAYHVGLPGVAGGFTCVDVFFVLSGFLITRNILADLEAGRFTLRGFYARRARRTFASAGISSARAATTGTSTSRAVTR